MNRVVLASASPRRRQLLRLIGLEHLVRPAEADESLLDGEAALAYVARLACDKAEAVAGAASALPVIGADTVVAIGSTILGKPSSPADAERMLESLSGATHEVHTAVAVVAAGRCEHLVDTARVQFRTLSPEVIRWYVGTGEPMDKAGAYAIQGAGGLLVESVQGSPQTVVGLPIHRLPELFARHRIDFLDLLESTC